jgi:type IV pilus assembly protein PilA
MSTSERQVPAPQIPAGWYADPATGTPGYWTGVAWAPTQPVPAPGSPPGLMPGNLVPSHRAQGRRSSIELRWVGVAVAVVLVLVGGFALLHKRNAQPAVAVPQHEATGQQAGAASPNAVDAALKSDLRTVATEMETYYTDASAYPKAVARSTNPPTGANLITVGKTKVRLSPGNAIMVTVGKTSYAICGFNLKGTANARAQSYLYESNGGGLLGVKGSCPATMP